MNVDAVILAAGSGTRMKAGCNKVFLTIGHKEVLLHTVEAFERSSSVDRIIVVTGADDIDRCKSLLADCSKVKSIIKGGATRQESSYIGVCACESEYVMIHDGARALIDVEDIDNVASAAMDFGASAVGCKCADTMKRCSGGNIVSTVDRDDLYKVYTPQCFRRTRLIELHEKAQNNNYSVTDDCALYEWGGEVVRMIEGNPHNIKLTTPEDICIAEAILAMR